MREEPRPVRVTVRSMRIARGDRGGRRPPTRGARYARANTGQTERHPKVSRYIQVFIMEGVLRAKRIMDLTIIECGSAAEGCAKSYKSNTV